MLLVGYAVPTAEVDALLAAPGSLSLPLLLLSLLMLALLA